MGRPLPELGAPQGPHNPHRPSLDGRACSLPQLKAMKARPLGGPFKTNFLIAHFSAFLFKDKSQKD